MNIIIRGILLLSLLPGMILSMPDIEHWYNVAQIPDPLKYALTTLYESTNKMVFQNSYELVTPQNLGSYKDLFVSYNVIKTFIKDRGFNDVLETANEVYFSFPLEEKLDALYTLGLNQNFICTIKQLSDKHSKNASWWGEWEISLGSATLLAYWANNKMEDYQESDDFKTSFNKLSYLLPFGHIVCGGNYIYHKLAAVRALAIQDMCEEMSDWKSSKIN